jgi:hypothetical protein
MESSKVVDGLCIRGAEGFLSRRSINYLTNVDTIGRLLAARVTVAWLYRRVHFYSTYIICTRSPAVGDCRTLFPCIK